MDKLDVAVVRELLQGSPNSPTRPEVRLSFRAVARRLQVSEGTVRARAKKLVDSGFIRGWAVHLNPNLLGLRERAVMVDVIGGSKRAAVEKLLLIEGTVLLVNYHGTGVGMIFFYKDEKSLRRKLDLIAMVAGGAVHSSGDIPYPSCDLRLSLVDWKILASLQKRPGGSYAEIAKELGLSARTVKRRMTRMTKGSAAFILVSGDEAKLTGTVRCDLHVKWGDPRLRPEAEAALLRLLQDFNFFSGLWTTFSVFNLFVPNVQSTNDLLRKASALKGVDGARIEFLQERHEAYDVLSDQIDEKVAELEKERA